MHSRQVGEQAFYSGRFEPNMGFWHTTASAARACAEESDSFLLLEKTLKSQFSSSTVMGPPLSGGLFPSCAEGPLKAVSLERVGKQHTGAKEASSNLRRKRVNRGS